MNRKYSSTLKKKLVSIILILLLISPSVVSNAYSFTKTNYTKEYGYDKYFSSNPNDYFNYDYEIKDYFKSWKQNAKEESTYTEEIENEETEVTNENTQTNITEEIIKNNEYITNENINTENTEIQNASLEDYMGYLTELDIFTEIMNTNKDTDIAIEEIMNKISELEEKYQGSIGISDLSDKISEGIISLPNVDTETLINTISSYLEEMISNFGDIDFENMNFENIDFGDIDFGNMNFGDMDFENMDFGNMDFGGMFGSTSGDFTPDIVESNMIANTAGKLSGEEYRVKLSGNIYFSNPDENGNPTSDKWVVLVHGFLMSGESITNTLGQMYLDQGFNILAPDMRGFGNSEGSVALGYLESLDMWDWITYINENYSENCDEIIVHGLSLGGATTVFLSGLEVDGETLKDKNVIGLIEDCGYSSMSEIVATSASTDDPKAYIMDSLDVGLTEENFDELENGLNSIAKCSVPLLIIHGTDDTTVPFENSDRIYNAAVANKNIPYVQRYSAEGQGHAFIFMGTNYDEYKGHVETFVNKAENISFENNTNKNEDSKEESGEIINIQTSYTPEVLYTEETYTNIENDTTVETEKNWQENDEVKEAEEKNKFSLFGNYTAIMNMFKNMF